MARRTTAYLAPSGPLHLTPQYFCQPAPMPPACVNVRLADVCYEGHWTRISHGVGCTIYTTTHAWTQRTHTQKNAHTHIMLWFSWVGDGWGYNEARRETNVRAQTACRRHDNDPVLLLCIVCLCAIVSRPPSPSRTKRMWDATVS